MKVLTNVIHPSLQFKKDAHETTSSVWVHIYLKQSFSVMKINKIKLRSNLSDIQL